MQEGERKNKSLLGWIKDNCEQMSQEPWQPSHFNQTEDSDQRKGCSALRLRRWRPISHHLKS